jgi:hypothetical protein
VCRRNYDPNVIARKVYLHRRSNIEQNAASVHNIKVPKRLSQEKSNSYKLARLLREMS